MRIDQTTRLFTELTDEEAGGVVQVVEDIVLRGKVPYPTPAFVQEWMDTFFPNSSQALLILSTVFVQVALLSVVYHYRGSDARLT